MVHEDDTDDCAKIRLPEEKSWMIICVIILLVREEFPLLYVLGVWTSFAKCILTFHVLILILFDNNILFIYISTCAYVC